MHKVNIHEAKTHLSKLIQEVLDGEEVIIAKDNKPLVKLIPLPNTATKREPGSAKGLIEIADDFDAPLEDFDKYIK